VQRIFVACAVAAATLTLGVGAASAAKPAVAGCVGASVSANAHALHPYGSFISFIAPRNDFGSVGDAVHAVQAGVVPDSVYNNTCNG
jgi:hypothetical protein